MQVVVCPPAAATARYTAPASAIEGPANADAQRSLPDPPLSTTGKPEGTGVGVNDWKKELTFRVPIRALMSSLSLSLSFSRVAFLA